MLSDKVKAQDTSDVRGVGGGSSTINEQPPNVEITDKADETTAKASSAGVSAINPKPDFPPPKTDKPRPHVCGTCNRSFARLEHLKRHERSHTKEKPFECPECTRCFARRDLLLRHQQKLHLTTTPSSRQRSGRRESTSSAAGVGKARKGSMTQQGGSASMRPRANTISHVDGATLGKLAAANSSVRPSPANRGHSTHPSLGGLAFGKPVSSGLYRPHGLPRIDTNGLNLDIGGGLRTAPVFGGFPVDLDMTSFLYNNGPNTVNPAQLHFADSPQSMAFETPISPFQQGFGHAPTFEDDGGFEWISGFNSSMTFDTNNEHAIAGSSPSANSTGSPEGASELFMDGAQHQSQDIWQRNSINSQGTLISDISMDMSGSNFPDILGDTLSPKAMDFGLSDNQFASPKPFSMNTPSFNSFNNGLFPLRPQTDSPLTDPSISGSSNRHSSVVSTAADTITDATRQALIAVLSQPGPFNHRKYPQPTISSPLSPGFQKTRGTGAVNLPSTYDFQRYINAYIKYFHPRLPFLHIPTLSFDSTSHGSPARMSLGHNAYASHAGGDGGCLILSMAAIGALFEFDYTVSRELFDAAKKLIQIFLEERRRADISAAINLAINSNESAASNTPLWLVQSMLLNVVYGHNCGDRTSADIASQHCAALVSLARAAGLAKPTESPSVGNFDDIQMINDGWNPQHNTSDDSIWYTWKASEEKKRTLYSIFVLSSMLVSSYNFPPSLTNSEIRLDLPCDEDLWAAESPAAWYGLGGGLGPKGKAISFAGALSSLLTASQRHPYSPQQIQVSSRPQDARLTSPHLPSPEFHASEFGCLVLIIALHNYIWETRQRHLGRQWTHQETEAMQAHIGPALLAYQAVWRESPQHNIQRPNPFGASDLSADCVPWLDLAYVRLFVALGRSKECFWHRDWDGMAHEIARGCEIVQHADDFTTGSSRSPLGDATQRLSPSDRSPGANNSNNGNGSDYGGGRSSKRERHLRKAASHAAHSLAMADKFNVSLADFPSREMSIGSAMCANDCAQVVAEWVSTVQERVGPYVGVIGRDDNGDGVGIDFEGVPAMMLLEPEDVALLRKVDGVVKSLEIKIAAQAQDFVTNPMDDGSNGNGGSGILDLSGAGLACKLLTVAAKMCETGGTWSIMHLMARSLESQAEFMKLRAEKSLVKDESEMA